MTSDEKEDKYNFSNGGAYTQRKKWTSSEVEQLTIFKKNKLSIQEIAKNLNRTEISVSLKWKRMNKENKTYNKNHLLKKYETNLEFLELIEPKSVLDLYAGEHSYYERLKEELKDLNENTIKQITTNDINKNFDKNDYNMDALRLLCKLYYENKKYDLIDIDPFGSAYDCLDLSIKMAKKALIVTYGEYGHKRWKRYDYLQVHYNISSEEDFNNKKFIEVTKNKGIQNKKELTPIYIKQWDNILRVYYKITDIKKDIWNKKIVYSNDI